jgi:hypothetical protein
MDIAPDGAQFPLWIKKPSRCVLADELRCSYFETAVLAGIPGMSNEHKQAEAQEAEDTYKERHTHEHRFSKRSLVRARINGVVGLQEDVNPKTHTRPGIAGNKIAGRVIRLSGRGRNKVAR